MTNTQGMEGMLEGRTNVTDVSVKMLAVEEWGAEQKTRQTGKGQTEHQHRK